MSFKIRFFLLSLIIFNISFSQEKWNIILANWKDLSFNKDKTIGIMLKKSILSQLQKEKDFNLIEIKDEGIFFKSISEANAYSLSNKGDIIVYGYYYVEGKSLFVITEVWDALKKQLKMRDEARGVVTIDIFDTIDEIALKIRKRIREVLPALNIEQEVEIKKLRKVVYEREEIKVERLFYTRIGANAELGHKKIIYPSSWIDGKPTDFQTMEGNFPEIFSIIGITLRYWDIRVDFGNGSFPGFPVYIAGKNEWEFFSLYGNTFFFLSYYLPFWNKQLAIGVGTLSIESISGIWIEIPEGTNIAITNFNRDNMLNFPLSLQVIWCPLKNFEFSLIINPIPVQNSEYVERDGRKYYRETTFSIFPIQISGIYFFLETFGIEARVSYARGLYNHGELVNGDTREKRDEVEFELLSTYVGFVYRVDFMKEK